MSEDVIDAALGILPGSRLDLLRRNRPQVRERTQSSYLALFAPAAPGRLTLEERLAAAARVAELTGCAPLVALYRKPASPKSERLAAILAHAEKLGVAPGDATPADLEKLAEAGLTEPEIVTLSQVISFVAYQARVVASLAALGETA